MRNAIQTSLKASAAVLFGFGALTYASSASAACGVAFPQHASWQTDQEGAGAHLQLASQSNATNTSIVGMWSFKMTANGQTADFGYQQWHSDGTELMNSGSRAPATENFCMGVWRQTGPSRFRLSHYALSYDASSGQLNGKVLIKEEVNVSPSGTTFNGTFTLDIYDPNTNAPTLHVAGQVAGQRVPQY